MNVAYVRVSSADQHEDRQLKALEPYGIEKYFIEKYQVRTETGNS